jgi:hypothetical protein
LTSKTFSISLYHINQSGYSSRHLLGTFTHLSNQSPIFGGLITKGFDR